MFHGKYVPNALQGNLDANVEVCRIFVERINSLPKFFVRAIAEVEGRRNLAKRKVGLDVYLVHATTRLLTIK
jgi:hypothetical protein